MNSNDGMIKMLSSCKCLFENGNFITGETVAMYALALSSGGLSTADVQRAILKLSRTSDKFPAVAKIFAAADDVTAAAAGTANFDAGQAWGEAMDNVRRNHVYKPWVYSRPEVEQAVNEFGGKMALIELQVDNVNTARAQFMKIYNGIIARQKNQRQNAAVLNSMGAARVAALVSNTADARKLKPA